MGIFSRIFKIYLISQMEGVGRGGGGGGDEKKIEI